MEVSKNKQTIIFIFKQHFSSKVFDNQNIFITFAFETAIFETAVSKIHIKKQRIGDKIMKFFGRENEIDIIAADELEEEVTFYEVKLQASDISIGILKDKAEHFFQTTGKFKKFYIEYKGLSMEDM